MQHAIATGCMWTFTVVGLIALYFALRRPVWVRRDYGARRYHGASALAQGVPMYRPGSAPSIGERPTEADAWTSEQLAAMAADVEPARTPTPVCILDRATIEEINWAQAWKDLDNKLEQQAREVDRRLSAVLPGVMGIYRDNNFIHSKIHSGDIAGLLRADTAALEILFAGVEALLSDAEQLQAA